MASRRIRRRPIAPTRARPPLLAVLLSYALYVLMIAVFSVALFLAWPNLSAQIQQRFLGASAPAEQLTPAPTLAPAARLQLQQAAPASAIEQQAIQQAIPTPDTSAPPPLPVDATAAVVNQPLIAPADAQQFSPVDLGWAPIPTPTTMLSSEQYADSQASEEQNFLNNAEQGLTEAQKLVRIHEAERRAKEGK